MLGLGFSIGTNGQPLSAPVFVVSSFDDFERYQSQIAGKIVVVNRVYANYGEYVPFVKNSFIDIS